MKNTPRVDLTNQLGNTYTEYQLLNANEEIVLSRTMATASFHILTEASMSPECLPILKEFLRKFFVQQKAQGKAVPGLLQAKIFAALDMVKANCFYEVEVAGELQYLCNHIRDARALLAELSIPSYIIIDDLYPLLINVKGNRFRAGLERRYNSFMKARDRLVLANSGLVKSIARRYGYFGIGINELEQEGMVGLIKAAERYDHQRGFRFSSYAYRSISRYIHAYVERNATKVRLPNPILRQKKAIDNKLRMMEHQSGSAVGFSQLSQYFDVDKHDLASLVSNSTSVSADYMIDIAPLADIETVTSEMGSLGLQFSELSTLKTELINMISRLPERNRKILCLRYGIGYKKEHTLGEISQQLSLSSERVRQLVGESIVSLRNLVGS